jgi:hypothetical protein
MKERPASLLVLRFSRYTQKQPLPIEKSIGALWSQNIFSGNMRNRKTITGALIRGEIRNGDASSRGPWEEVVGTGRYFFAVKYGGQYGTSKC